ncbi:MAG TPA: glycoside hydrolase family 19 protein [Rhodopila sp.]|nr:glycoside hydrolase family 19 protein [Rhodopila sp.]
MSGITAALDALLWPPASEAEPAAAVAAAAMLAGSAPLAAGHLDAALRAVAPRLDDAARAAWLAALGMALTRHGITAPRCVAAFLGQCAVESAGFRVLEEDLNYSAPRLREVWPARFPTEEAASVCAFQPEKLANVVYADRMGNGDPASGDGWRFRGRGLIQMTGKATYERFAAAMGLSLEQAVALAGTTQGAADSAAWFWTAHDLNALARSWALLPITRRINGGTEGWAERARLCNAALHAMGAY